MREAERVLTVREGESLQQISAIEAVFRAQFVQATKYRNAYAQKHIIERYDRAERERRDRNEEIIAYWRKRTTLERAAIAQAKELRKSVPEFLPHPDDVIIDSEAGVRFIGPFDQDSLAETNGTIALRDMLILRAGLDEKLWDQPDDGNPLEGPGSAAILATVLDGSLPPRLQMKDVLIWFRIDSYSRHPKRWLLKEFYAGWQKLGRTVRRGQLFPKLGVGKRIIEFANDFSEASISGELDTSYLHEISVFIQASGLLPQLSGNFQQ